MVEMAVAPTLLKTPRWPGLGTHLAASPFLIRPIMRLTIARFLEEGGGAGGKVVLAVPGAGGLLARLLLFLAAAAAEARL